MGLGNRRTIAEHTHARHLLLLLFAPGKPAMSPPLRVGDWSFKIWRLGVPQPVVMSPAGSSCFTAARWSPTRPSILYIGTHDGYLQVRAGVGVG